MKTIKKKLGSVYKLNIDSRNLEDISHHTYMWHDLGNVTSVILNSIVEKIRGINIK